MPTLEKVSFDDPVSPGGKLIMIEDAGGYHWYPHPTNGELYISVTGFLQAFPKGVWFNKWLADQGGYENAEAAKKEGGDRGTRVHDTIEELLVGKTVRFDEYQARYKLDTMQAVTEYCMVLDFMRWFATEKPKKILAIEYKLLCEEHKYGGKFDIYFINQDGQYELLDIKTSGAIYDTFPLQLQGYSYPMIHELSMPVDVTSILRLGSKHKCGYEYKKYPGFDAELFGIVLATKQIWHHANPNARPRSISVPESLSLSHLLHAANSAPPSA